MRTETRNSYERGLECVLAYILAHLDEPLDPRVLANEAHFSLYHFHRIFRGMMQESIGEFVRRVRMERAAYRLGNGAAVTETAFDAGFESHEAFTRAFRAAFGVSPRQRQGARQERFFLGSPNGIHYDPTGRFLYLRNFEGELSMHVEIRTRPAFRVLAMRHVGPYPEIGAVFGRLAPWAGQHGVPFQEALAIFYDNPEVVPAAELRSDAGLVVSQDFQSDDPAVHFVEIPTATYAVATYMGHYSGLSGAWGEFIGKWIPQSGHELVDGLSFEVYMNDCTTTAPEELRTDLYVPIK